MSEPKIAVKCQKCGEVTLVRLRESAILEGYFRCSKCGNVEYPRDKTRGPEEPTEKD
jgi:predicted RNA-binding Zn-ribbon protein involved in translation (DUF1610 family)